MVRRNSLFVSVIMGFALTTLAKADDSPASPPAIVTEKPDASVKTPHPVPASPPAPLSRQRRQRRQQWEQGLQAPADLSFGDQKTIPLGKLLEQIREKHALNIQLDMPHVIAMASAFGTGSGASGGRMAGGTAWIPFGIQSSYSSEPVTYYPAYTPMGIPTAMPPGLPMNACPACAAPAIAGTSAPACLAPSNIAPAATAPLYAAPGVPAPGWPAGVSAVPAANAPSYLPPANAKPVSSNAAPAASLPTQALPAIPFAVPGVQVAQVAAQGNQPPARPADDDAGAAVLKDPVDPGAAPLQNSPKADPPNAELPGQEAAESPKAPPGNSIDQVRKAVLDMPVDTSLVVQPNATVEDVLRLALAQALPLQAIMNEAMANEIPMLASFTKAAEWDLLVQDNGILITTRLNANLQKETRVYSLRALEQSSDLVAEDVARVLTRTVRPWSWRRHLPEAMTEAEATASSARKTKGRKVSIPRINLDLLSLLMSANHSGRTQTIRLTSGEEIIADVSPPSSGASPDKVELTEEDMELIGKAWDGLFQGAVTSLQVIYHSDPPTGVIQVLPGMLIISQSQGAHREIADLLEQLAHPEN